MWKCPPWQFSVEATSSMCVCGLKLLLGVSKFRCHFSFLKLAPEEKFLIQCLPGWLLSEVCSLTFCLHKTFGPLMLASCFHRGYINPTPKDLSKFQGCWWWESKNDWLTGPLLCPFKSLDCFEHLLREALGRLIILDSRNHCHVSKQATGAAGVWLENMLRALPWVKAGTKEGPDSKWRKVKEIS